MVIEKMNYQNKSRDRKASAFLIIGHETFNLRITLYKTIYFKKEAPFRRL